MKVLLMADNPVIEFLGPVLILSTSFTFLSTRQTKFILCEAYEVGFDFVFPPEQLQSQQITQILQLRTLAQALLV